MGKPDPFRTRYRSLVTDLVTTVVRTEMNKKDAIALVQNRAEAKVSAADRARFVEGTEYEMISLNEGNIARFNLRPAEFLAWHKVWHQRSLNQPNNPCKTCQTQIKTP